MRTMDKAERFGWTIVLMLIGVTIVLYGLGMKLNSIDDKVRAIESTQVVVSETVVVEPMPSDWASIPDCDNEDDVISNGVDCKWDAGSAGNGEGHSFYGRNGVMHYVS